MYYICNYFESGDLMPLNKFEVITNAEMYYNAFSSHLDKPFNHIDTVYLFTNENVPFILENSNLDGKLLTVTASFDQALNAALLGVKDITMFDINKIAKYFAELKKTAIEKLTYADFLKLYNLKETPFGKFKINYSKNIDSQIVQRLCQDMDYYYALFFEKLFELGFFDKKNQGYYYSFVCNPNHNLYLRKEKFYELKNILQDVIFNEYIDCNLFDIKKYIGKEKFSTVLLSNITSYFDQEELKKFNILLHQMEDNLIDNGIIQIGLGNLKNSGIIDGSCAIDRKFVDKNKDKIKEIKIKEETITYYHKTRRKNGKY